MSIITLGNTAPQTTDGGHMTAFRADGSLIVRTPIVPVALHDPREAHTTVVDVPEEWTREQVAQNLLHLWPAHSAERPGWLLADDEDLQTYLQQVFDLEPPPGPTALLTNAGRDFVSAQLHGSASATAVAKWIALTANATAAGAGDTTLTGEIATASGGLIRAVSALAHTTGTNVSTMTNTFTANGSDSLPVTLAKVGLFTQLAVGGTLVYETLFGTTATLSASGDACAVTWTLTEG